MRYLCIAYSCFSIVHFDSMVLLCMDEKKGRQKKIDLFCSFGSVRSSVDSVFFLQLKG